MIIINKVVLVGRLTKDPEIRFAAGTGKAVCRFTMAVPRQFKKDESDFINCIAFDKTGETIGKYVQKGHQFAISGNIRTGSYEASDGTRRYTTDVVVESFDFINGGSKQENKQNNNFDDNLLGESVEDGDCPF